MKKVFAAVLAACLALALFTGCVAKKTVDIGEKATPTPAETGAAEATAQPSETVSEETEAPADFTELTELFPWLSYTAGVALCTDDPEQTGTSAKEAQGRYVMVQIACPGGEFAWEDISENYTMFTLRGADGTLYEAGSVTFTLEEGMDFRNLAGESFASFGVVFDIPEEVALDTLTLLVDTDAENEHITVNMADVPIE